MTTETLQIPTNKKEKLLFADLSYGINGILFEVHNELGRFAREKQYADLVETKLKGIKISYRREMEVGDSGNKIDLNIEDKIVVELKAKPFLTDADYSQVKRYLHSTNLQLGILVNFREKVLNPRRVLNLYQNL